MSVRGQLPGPTLTLGGEVTRIMMTTTAEMRRATLADSTVAELKSQLTQLGIPFRSHDTKSVLIQKLIDAQQQSSPARSSNRVRTSSSTSTAAAFPSAEVVARRRSTRTHTAPPPISAPSPPRPSPATPRRSARTSTNRTVAAVTVESDEDANEEDEIVSSRPRRTTRRRTSTSSTAASSSSAAAAANSTTTAGRGRASRASRATPVEPSRAARRGGHFLSHGAHPPRPIGQAPPGRVVNGRWDPFHGLEFAMWHPSMHHHFGHSYGGSSSDSDTDDMDDESGGSSQDSEIDGLPNGSDTDESVGAEESFWTPLPPVVSSSSTPANPHPNPNPIAEAAMESRRLLEILLRHQRQNLSAHMRQLEAHQRQSLGTGLRFKRDPKRTIMSADEVARPPQPPINMTQFIDIVSRSNKFIPAAPSAAPSHKQYSHIKPSDFIEMLHIDPTQPSSTTIHSHTPTTNSLIHRHSLTTQEQLMPSSQANLPSGSFQPLHLGSQVFQLANLPNSLAAMSQVPLVPTLEAFGAVASAAASTHANRTSEAYAQMMVNRRRSLGPASRVPMRSGPNYEENNTTAANTISSTTGVPSSSITVQKSHLGAVVQHPSFIPQNLDELRQFVRIFLRPDSLGASFQQGGQETHRPIMDSSEAAAASMMVDTVPPVIRVGILPIDLVTLRIQFAKLFNMLRIDHELRLLFKTIWAYILDQTTTEEWLGFPVTYPRPPPIVTPALPIQPGGEPQPAPDLVTSYEDGDRKKRVRFTGLETAVATTAAAQARTEGIEPIPTVPATAAATSQMYAVPRVHFPQQPMSHLIDPSLPSLSPNPPATVRRQASIQSSTPVRHFQLPTMSIPIPPSYMIHSGPPHQQQHPQPDSSSVASPSSTSAMHQPIRFTNFPQLPPPMTQTPSMTNEMNRAPSDVVDLTLSDVDDDEAAPEPSSASTSFTQAPRMTLSGLVAQLDRQHQVIREQRQRRQLQSPSASSIRSMDYLDPMIDHADEQQMVNCLQCGRVNMISLGVVTMQPCRQCGTALPSPSVAQPQPVRQSSELTAMEIDQPNESPTAANVLPTMASIVPDAPSSIIGGSVVAAPSTRVPRVPASVTSEYSASQPTTLESTAGPMMIDNASSASVIAAPVTEHVRELSDSMTDQPPTMPINNHTENQPMNQDDQPFTTVAPPIMPNESATTAPLMGPPNSLPTPPLPTARTPLSTLITQSFFVLLQLPQLDEPTSILCRELWVCLAATPPDIQDEFVEFASSLPPAAARTELTRWVAAVQNCISLRLNTFRKQDQYLRGCVRSLALFHRVNEALKLRYPESPTSLTSQPSSVSPVLSRQLFLNDAITSLDHFLARDYRNYLSGLEAAAKEAANEAKEKERIEQEKQTNKQQHQKEPETTSRKRSRATRSSDTTPAAAAATPVAVTPAPTPTAPLIQYPPPPKNPNAKPVRLPRHFAFASFPFLLDAASFSRILLSESEREQQDHSQYPEYDGRLASMLAYRSNQGALVLSVRRQYLVQDTLHQLHQLSNFELKRPLKIVFANEEGIDAGGVKREFFSLLVRDLFSPDFNMFQTENEQYVFNPTSLLSPEDTLSSSASSVTPGRRPPLTHEAMNTLSEYELVGLILGLSIYNGVQLDIHFPSIIYKKLLAKSRSESPVKSGVVGGVGGVSESCDYTLADLSDSHPDLAKGLQSLLTYPAKSSKELEDTFGLYWTVDHLVFGATVTRELIPGGTNLPVTLENRSAYVDAYVKYILHDSIELQFNSFASGFYKVVSKKPLQLLTHPSDLELLICGNTTPNFDELELAASYDGWAHGGGSTHTRPSAPVIGHFWSFFHSLSIDIKKKLLAFVTGSSRIPIKGLRHIKFVLQNGGDNQEKLPESHTCFNSVLLPNYKDPQTLRKKFMLAIEEGGEGFQLK